MGYSWRAIQFNRPTTIMQFYVAQNGEKVGPLERDEVYRRLTKGELRGEDLGWHEGLADWEPLSKLLPPPSAAPLPVFGAGIEVSGLRVPQKTTSGLAITSLVCGILGFFCLGITSIVAVITGHMAKSKIKRAAGAIGGDGLALAGLILGYLGFCLIFVSVLASLAVPAFNSVQRQGNQMKSVSNAKQLVLGMKMYAQDHDGKFPPTLETLFDEQLIDDRRLLNVAGTIHAPEDGWEYRGAGLSDTSPSDTVVLVSRVTFPDKKRVVARLDGTAEPVLASEVP